MNSPSLQAGETGTIITFPLFLPAARWAAGNGRAFPFPQAEAWGYLSYFDKFFQQGRLGEFDKK